MALIQAPCGACRLCALLHLANKDSDMPTQKPHFDASGGVSTCQEIVSIFPQLASWMCQFRDHLVPGAFRGNLGRMNSL